jgi:excisionase family DNA binding protein
MDTTPEVFTIVEAARLLRVPEGWLRKKVTAGVVPHTRLGKHVRFTSTHLARILAEGEARLASPAACHSGISSRARRRTSPD